MQPAQSVLPEVPAQFPAAEGKAWVVEVGLSGRRVEFDRRFVVGRRFRVRAAEKGFVDAAAPFDTGKEPVAIAHERREPNQPEVHKIHRRHNAAGYGLFTIQD